MRHWALIWFLLTAGCVTPLSDTETVTETVPPGQTAQVIEVIDGDTIDVRLAGDTYRVRYVGVDTPERGDPYYQQATNANRALVGGQDVILVLDVSETDRFGRLLRYVYLPDGTFVNAELLRQGLARRVTFPPDVAQQTYFGRLQEEARLAQRGFWAEPELGGVCDCSGNRYNCADFTDQAAAQACFDFCQEMVGDDVHRLDGGGDGLVCESLP